MLLKQDAKKNKKLIPVIRQITEHTEDKHQNKFNHYVIIE